MAILKIWKNQHIIKKYADKKYEDVYKQHKKEKATWISIDMKMCTNIPTVKHGVFRVTKKIYLLS